MPLLSLPTELVEHVCDYEPSITPKLRATCRDLCQKASDHFKSHFFTDLTVFIDLYSIERLCQISLHPVFSGQIHRLCFLLADSPYYDLRSLPYNSENVVFIRSGDFKLHLSGILSRLPHCAIIEFAWAGTDDQTKIVNCLVGKRYDLSMEEWQDEPHDISYAGSTLISVLHAISASRVRTTEIRFGFDHFPLKLHELSEYRINELPRATLSLPYLESLAMHIDDVRIGEPDEGAESCKGFFEGFLQHLPQLKRLNLSIFSDKERGRAWSPTSFGPSVEHLVLREVNTITSLLTDGGGALVEPLRQTPMLKTLSMLEFMAPTLQDARQFLEKLSTVHSLQRVTVCSAYADHSPLCFTPNCATGREQVQHAKDWVASNLPQDLQTWQSSLHTHVCPWTFW